MKKLFTTILAFAIGALLSAAALWYIWVTIKGMYAIDTTP